MITRKRVRTALIMIILLIGVFAYGYLTGRGFFYESEYEIAKDATITPTGDAPDAFMSEYTTMTWEGRDSYGNFFVVYQPTNKGVPENEVVYTIFYEEDEKGNLIRVKIIDEKGSELIYKLNDIMKDYNKATIKEATDEGIVIALTKQGGEYNVFLPMTKAVKPVVVHGAYKLQDSKAHKTSMHKTTGRDASEVIKEIEHNFTYYNPEGGAK